ncbi:MAG: cyclophilin-like fold protein [Methanomassiliicoccales archaeon]
MPLKILMKTRYDVFEIELNDTETADAIYIALPLEREINVWGGEIFFDIGVKMPLENGRKVMEPGEVAFWPDGNAFCIFFGPTPVSRSKAPEAYSAVTPVGRILGDLSRLEELADRTEVRLDRP